MHQLPYLVAGITCHMADFGVLQALFTTLGTVFEDTQYPCFGGLPIDTAAFIRITVGEPEDNDACLKALGGVLAEYISPSETLLVR